MGTRDPKRAVKRMAKAREAKAEQFAAGVLPMIRAIEALGFTSNAAIAAQLNARKVPTARGKEWTHVQVGRARSRSSGLGPQFAASVLPMIRAIEALGFTSNAAIAAQLNARNVPTPRGKKWTRVQVGRARSRSSGLGPQFAASVLPMIRAIEALGFTSNAAIAAQLNARHVPSPGGKEWTHVQIGRVRSRSSGVVRVRVFPQQG